MNGFHRGVQLYLLLLAVTGTFALLWETNEFVLANSMAKTGWPLIVGVALALVPLGVIARHQWATDDRDGPAEQYPWSSRNR